MTTLKASPSRVFGGSMVSKGHRTISPPKIPIFGGPNTSGDASTSKGSQNKALKEMLEWMKTALAEAQINLEHAQRKMGNAINRS